MYIFSPRNSVSRYNLDGCFVCVYFGCQINACASAAVEVESSLAQPILGVTVTSTFLTRAITGRKFASALTVIAQHVGGTEASPGSVMEG